MKNKLFFVFILGLLSCSNDESESVIQSPLTDNVEVYKENLLENNGWEEVVAVDTRNPVLAGWEEERMVLKGHIITDQLIVLEGVDVELYLCAMENPVQKETKII